MVFNCSNQGLEPCKRSHIRMTNLYWIITIFTLSTVKFSDMTIIDFSLWLKESYNFDSDSNTLFKNALADVFRQFSNSTYDGVPFFQHYKHNLHQELKSHYVSLLEMLIGQIPEPQSRVSLNVLNIPLGDYYHQKQEILRQVSLLKN